MDHVTSKTSKAPVFRLPHRSNFAKMLRKDLGDARKRWLDAVKKNPDVHVRREQSDFLAEVNHEGEVLDFHSLRHSCGAWLAKNGEHPKVIQQIMRHSSITLTMDTYGHLFPGQEADAISRMRDTFKPPVAQLQATGTDDHDIKAKNSAQRQAQHTGFLNVHLGAKGCEASSIKKKMESRRRP